MDGNPKPKTKTWRGRVFSDTRHAVVTWLEKELPLLSGDFIDIGAGNWGIPEKLTDKNKVKSFKKFDQKVYAGTQNNVDFYGDIENMPKDWTNKWDVALCIEVIECIPDPFKAVKEMHRILKPGGVLLLSCPYNYRAFGTGTWTDPKQNEKGVNDYWRITKQGLELLAKQFSSVSVVGFGGTGNHDRFGHCMKAIK